ncbi:hypothetical protein [Secundilactobacillus folii]|uniref:Uncharacterized protein n=1 Tax=Secundilactobacillus folii TaxID=2678357 RepID=A0A7X2XV56_9LACO|nr:hypothetical protein [Secundilactobacillus folii]MTV82194.1 hypothetical protein [Secundilactobacillus folii]
MRNKVITGLVAASALFAFDFSGVTANAKASGTTPKTVRGTFYSYLGKSKWGVIKINVHSASTYTSKSGVKPKPFKISSTSKSRAHKLAYHGFKSGGRYYFSLQAQLSGAESVFPEDGFRLTSRKINGHRYKVIRGYQGGYGTDYIKGHKVRHAYSHRADASY